jgi:hypothetical protein
VVATNPVEKKRLSHGKCLARDGIRNTRLFLVFLKIGQTYPKILRFSLKMTNRMMTWRVTSFRSHSGEIGRPNLTHPAKQGNFLITKHGKNGVSTTLDKFEIQVEWVFRGQ